MSSAGVRSSLAVGGPPPVSECWFSVSGELLPSPDIIIPLRHCATDLVMPENEDMLAATSSHACFTSHELRWNPAAPIYLMLARHFTHEQVCFPNL
ncbi:hypothetical protein AAFF_G00109140 [Aldrovandia affinis]|uniref:Uncharacterized protein n=1 Tax=Aldrovandia affinis TaxID=143900 RepID=A0AAD7R108_9TELE|nr:hypothetical protein AAFF_G00109140 [Aldrovandia affinis]